MCEQTEEDLYENADETKSYMNSLRLRAGRHFFAFSGIYLHRVRVVEDNIQIWTSL